MDATAVTDDVHGTQPALIDGLERSIAAAVAGDAAVFTALIDARLARTYRIAIAILGSETDANDAVQDAWVAAWRRLPSLSHASKFDAWVDRIVVNSCRMAIRRRGRVREIPIPDGFDAASNQPGPEAIVERGALERAFDRLPIQQRTILVLHHLEERPLANIAEVLGIPVGTAKSRLHAARIALERMLEDER
jgi:RNA polymerase sigma-70 factor (ECF subfamily)